MSAEASNSGDGELGNRAVAAARECNRRIDELTQRAETQASLIARLRWDNKEMKERIERLESKNEALKKQLDAAETDEDSEKTRHRAAEEFRRSMASSEFITWQLTRDFFCTGDVYLLITSLTALAEAESSSFHRGVTPRIIITVDRKLPCLYVHRPEGTRWTHPAPQLRDGGRHHDSREPDVPPEERRAPHTRADESSSLDRQNRI